MEANAIAEVVNNRYDKHTRSRHVDDDVSHNDVVFEDTNSGSTSVVSCLVGSICWPFKQSRAKMDPNTS